MTSAPPVLTGPQQLTLILLRSLIGWHFAYEGYFKLLHPAWNRAGLPLEPFSSAGYLRNASGPLAAFFRPLADPGWTQWLDTGIALALLLAGLLLLLGWFSQLGGAIALVLLAAFYLSSMPLNGVPEPRAEGTYLIVNKTLIEAAAVIVLLAFRTGGIAGLDVLRSRAPRPLDSNAAVTSS